MRDQVEASPFDDELRALLALADAAVVTLASPDVSHLSEWRFRDERSPTVTEYLQVWRAKVAEADVERLLAVRPAAIAEAQRLCPELLRADLVRLGDGTWLDVLTWSSADGEERLMVRADEFDALHAMHALLEDAEQVGRGEIMAAAR